VWSIARASVQVCPVRVSLNAGTFVKEKRKAVHLPNQVNRRREMKFVTKCRVANCLFAFTIILLMLRLQPVNSQANRTLSGVHVVVGVATVKPTIDGVWGRGEWDDANEYRFSTIYYEVNGFSDAYIRCKHDSTLLYCLIDVPSDNGTAYVRGGQKSTGQLAWGFARDINGSGRIDPADFGFAISPSGNRTLLTFLYNKPAYSSQINVAQQLGVSPHSSKSHRVYEISMPFESLIQYNDLAANLPAVYVDLTVTDSYGNGLALSGSPYLSVLEFGGMPVPENIEPLIPLALALLTLVFCLHRKEVRNGHTATGRSLE
jgi:hypothetical protein